MGFRNPISSIGRVDTGLLDRAGVRIYQDNSGGYPRGVVEYYSGLDPSGRLEMGPYAIPQDGGFTSVGSFCRLTGVADHGAAAPTLELNVEEQPAGGYASAARVTADALYLPANTQVGAQVLGDTKWLAITLATGFTANGVPQVRRLNGVLYLRNGWSPAGMAASSLYNVGNLPAGMAPAVDSYIRAGTATADQQGMFLLRTSGVIQLRTGATLASYYRLEAGGGIPAD